jgi:hypothetical protein
MRVAVFVLGAVSLVVAGCIQVDQTVTLSPDGSGTLEASYSVADQAVEQLHAMRKLTQQMAAAAGEAETEIKENELAYLLLDPTKEGLEQEINKYRKYGVTTEELKVESRNARKYVTLKLRFKNLAEFAKSDVFQTYGFSLNKNTQGDYVLDRPASFAAGAAETDFSSPEMVRLLTPMLGGFNVIVKVRPPGGILKTNAHRSSQYMATWSFDFDRDSNALMALQKQRMVILFDGRGLDLPKITVKGPS